MCRSWVGRFSHSPPSEPQVSHLQLHLAIRDLNGAQLREVLEDLHLETARRKGMAPPLGSPLDQWWGPVGRVDADLDNGEVALQEGGDGDPASQCNSLWAPLEQRRMFVASSTSSRPD